MGYCPLHNRHWHSWYVGQSALSSRAAIRGYGEREGMIQMQFVGIPEEEKRAGMSSMMKMLN
jgi:hypothetical protein